MADITASQFLQSAQASGVKSLTGTDAKGNKYSVDLTKCKDAETLRTEMQKAIKTSEGPVTFTFTGTDKTEYYFTTSKPSPTSLGGDQVVAKPKASFGYKDPNTQASESPADVSLGEQLPGTGKPPKDKIKPGENKPKPKPNVGPTKPNKVPGLEEVKNYGIWSTYRRDNKDGKSNAQATHSLATMKLKHVEGRGRLKAFSAAYQEWKIQLEKNDPELYRAWMKHCEKMGGEDRAIEQLRYFNDQIKNGTNPDKSKKLDSTTGFYRLDNTQAKTKIVGMSPTKDKDLVELGDTISCPFTKGPNGWEVSESIKGVPAPKKPTDIRGKDKPGTLPRRSTLTPHINTGKSGFDPKDPSTTESHYFDTRPLDEKGKPIDKGIEYDLPGKKLQGTFVDGRYTLASNAINERDPRKIVVKATQVTYDAKGNPTVLLYEEPGRMNGFAQGWTAKLQGEDAKEFLRKNNFGGPIAEQHAEAIRYVGSSTGSPERQEAAARATDGVADFAGSAGATKDQVASAKAGTLQPSTYLAEGGTGKPATIGN